MPTRVAETSWQISTSRRMGLRKLAGFSTSRASWRAPRFFSSTSDLALIRFIRTRLVSAMARTPEAASSDRDDDDEDGVLGVEARCPQQDEHAQAPWLTR